MESGGREAIWNGKVARAILNAALLLVNHARCRSSSERVTTRQDGPARRAPLIRLSAGGSARFLRRRGTQDFAAHGKEGAHCARPCSNSAGARLLCLKRG